MRSLSSVGLILVALVVAAPARAIVRPCGDDALANTETVLCAPPSGPCTPTEVVLGTNVTVLDHRCVLDLGGRGLRIERTLRMPKGLETRLEIQNVADVTIAPRGRLKLRGDFPGKTTDFGGVLKIVSHGTIGVAGLLDVSGDPSGLIEIIADGDLIFERVSRVRGRGVSSLNDEGFRFADGGDLLVRASTVAVLGTFDFAGSNAAAGGDVDLTADRAVTISGRIDARGGDGDGGDVSVTAGDDVQIAAPITVDARTGSGSGGAIDIIAGLDHSNPDDSDIGAVPGGKLQVSHAILTARANALEGFGGFGGDVSLTAADDVVVTSDVTIRVDAAPNGDGAAGSIAMSAGDDLSGVPRDGDLSTTALLSARGPDLGGEVFFLAGRDVSVGGSLDATGGTAGRLVLEAGRDARIDGPLVMRAASSGGAGVDAEFTAGVRALGTLRVSHDLDLSGGAPNSCAFVNIAACYLTVDAAVTIDARCPALGGLVTQTVLLLTARNGMDLGAASRYLAGPVGRVVTTHPTAVTPVIGAGTVFTAVRGDQPNDAAQYPRCAPEP